MYNIFIFLSLMLMCASFSDLFKTHFVLQIFCNHFGNYFCGTNITILSILTIFYSTAPNRIVIELTKLKR